MADAVLIALAVSILLGLAAQTLASLTRMPAIVYLLVLGVLAGPQGLGLVLPQSLGKGLEVLTACFVAVILFEGGLTLPPRVLRGALAPVRRLITVGALVTMAGGAVASRLILGIPWSVAALFGALVIVTGPTVITPILRRVRLVPRLHAILKTEGILIDAVGAIAAVVALEYVVALDSNLGATLVGFVARLGTGLLVGSIVGGIAIISWRLPFFHLHENQHLVQLGALGVALASFAIAERIYSEAGIAAATAAGLLMAASPIPFRHELERFKETLTTLGVSVLFVLLSANLDWKAALSSGWRPFGVVLALMFVVRPVSVWVSTWGMGLEWAERAYLGLLAPRGIVAAAMSSHFAGELRRQQAPGADMLETLVFLTIGVTVCVQGSWAGWLARRLGVRARRPNGVLVVGVNTWSLALGEALRQRSLFVLFADVNPIHVDRAREQGFAAELLDASDDESYATLDLAEIGVAIATTSNDAVNTLACDAAAEWLGPDAVYQVLSKPVDGEPRAAVRMSGRWAMPSLRSHQTICTLLRRESVELTSITLETPATISRDMRGVGGIVVPLLVVEEKRTRLAEDGEVCPAGSILVGLAERRAESERGREGATDEPEAFAADVEA